MTSTTLLLVGRIGNGKSSTGNSILGEKKFKPHSSSYEGSREILKETTDKGVAVVDGFDVDEGDSNLEINKARSEEASKKCDGSIKAFVLVLKYGVRFTKQEKDAVDLIRFVFGQNVLKSNGVIVLSHGDNFDLDMEDEGLSFEGWCENQTGDVKALFKECGSRIVLFNNKAKDSENQRQVQQLMKKVNEINQDYVPANFQDTEMVPKGPKQEDTPKTIIPERLAQADESPNTSESVKSVEKDSSDLKTQQTDSITSIQEKGVAKKQDEKQVKQPGGEGHGGPEETESSEADKSQNNPEIVRSLKDGATMGLGDQEKKGEIEPSKEQVEKTVEGFERSDPMESKITQQSPSDIDPEAMRKEPKGQTGSDKMESSQTESEGKKMTSTTLLLVGRIGNGKSSTGNSILGEKKFKPHSSSYEGSREILKETTDKGVAVVDGFDVDEGDSNLEINKARSEEASKKCDGSIKAFVLVLKYGVRFTKQEKDAVDLIRFVFGQNVLKSNGVIVLSHGDNFDLDMEDEGLSFEGWCENQTGDVKALFKECGSRIVLFNNKAKDSENQRQVQQLMKKVNEINQDYVPANFQDTEMVPKGPKQEDTPKTIIPERLAQADESPNTSESVKSVEKDSSDLKTQQTDSITSIQEKGVAKKQDEKQVKQPGGEGHGGPEETESSEADKSQNNPEIVRSLKDGATMGLGDQEKKGEIEPSKEQVEKTVEGFERSDPMESKITQQSPSDIDPEAMRKEPKGQTGSDKMESSQTESEGKKMTSTTLLLVGRIGNGKSSTGNSILGEKKFKPHSSSYEGSREILKETTDKGVAVVDGFDVDEGDSNLEINKARSEEASKKCDGSIKAFVLVLKYGVRFTKQEKDAVDLIRFVFGQNVLKSNGVIVLSHGDNFDLDMEDEGLSFEGWCENQTGDVKALFKECGSRIVLFNNKAKDSENQRQVQQLMKKVNEINQDYVPANFQDTEMVPKGPKQEDTPKTIIPERLAQADESPNTSESVKSVEKDSSDLKTQQTDSITSIQEKGVAKKQDEKQVKQPGGEGHGGPEETESSEADKSQNNPEIVRSLKDGATMGLDDQEKKGEIEPSKEQVEKTVEGFERSDPMESKIIQQSPSDIDPEAMTKEPKGQTGSDKMESLQTEVGAVGHTVRNPKDQEPKETTKRSCTII